MYKIIKADADAYLTDRVIRSVRKETANVGCAGSLDLFKLYGMSFSGSNPNVELSRLLVHFDLDPLRTLVRTGDVDITDSSFSCHMKLFDVYAGQPCPINFDVCVHPLSRSFDEGLGRDVALYTDVDVCNFLTASRGTDGIWLLSGANYAGTVTGSCDYIDAFSDGTATVATQRFVTGEENLYVDVTAIVSSTLTNQIPDAGFRIAFSESIETDQRTYFVKRFASRQAYDEAKHPQLIVRYDDSVFDDSSTFEFDADNTLYLRNYSRGDFKNLTSGSDQVTGSNCLLLKMVTEVSGGTHTLYYTGSQVTNSIGHVTGTYYATVNIPTTNVVINSLLSASNTLDFMPVWCSLDATHAYLTGSTITASTQNRTSSVLRADYNVSAMGLKGEHNCDEKVLVEVKIFDTREPYTMIMRIPAEMPSIAVHDAFYAVRDVVSNAYAIPFDSDTNSTKLSCDGTGGMYFYVDMSSLTVGHVYVVDVMIKTRGNDYFYRSASPEFKVTNVQ